MINQKFLVAVASTILMMFSYSASAQMRHECDPDSPFPGACYFEPYVGGVLLACELPDWDGFLFTAPGTTPGTEVSRNIGLFTPNGKVMVHQTAEILFAAACTAEDFLSGICGLGTGEWFEGVVSLQANGFSAPDGGITCPFKATAKGILSRDVGYGPEEIEIDAVLHTVKDKDVGCRVQQCRIFARDQGE